MEDEVVRCPSCGSPARSRSPDGGPVCARCGVRLAYRWPMWLFPALIALALLGLVLFTFFAR